MKKTIRRRDPAPAISGSDDLHPVIEQIYATRGISDSKELDRSLKQLYPYTELKGIDDACQRLYQALSHQEKILIIGDYDADGATSTTVAVRGLRSLGAKHVDYLVPNRFEYGYGLTPEIVDVANELKPNLIITVDNGISSCEGVARAAELGIDVVVTDHHLPGNELPKPAAMVNPNQPGDNFPSKALAGVGVIFYVMLALRAYLRDKNWFEQQGIEQPQLANLLDIVALGTVADVVPLDHLNRTLVYQGLGRIRAGKAHAGIYALIQVAKRNHKQIRSSDMGFALGPRLNAAGRLDDMSVGIECLLSDNMEHALALAQQLDELNKERRFIEDGMKQEAFKAIDVITGKTDKKAIPLGFCLFQESWHQGVIGILAGRIKELYYRPVIAFACGDNGQIKGSARSIKGLHIRDVLDRIATKAPGLILKFGGHAMAAGLSIMQKDFGRFHQVYLDALTEMVDPDILKNEILSDGALVGDSFTLSFAEILQSAGPWGQNFPEPIFDGCFSVLDQRLVGQNHLRLTLKAQDSETPIEAIAFNIDVEKWPNFRCQKINAAYQLDINEYKGLRKPQLVIQYFEEA